MNQIMRALSLFVNKPLMRLSLALASEPQVNERMLVLDLHLEEVIYEDEDEDEGEKEALAYCNRRSDGHGNLGNAPLFFRAA